MAAGRRIEDERYLFLNKRRRIAKALWFDGSGWCVLAKRLEAGSFQLPPFDGSELGVSRNFRTDC
jgi:transposase